MKYFLAFPPMLLLISCISFSTEKMFVNKNGYSLFPLDIFIEIDSNYRFQRTCCHRAFSFLHFSQRRHYDIDVNGKRYYVHSLWRKKTFIHVSRLGHG